jgi:hypothetical protein
MSATASFLEVEDVTWDMVINCTLAKAAIWFSGGGPDGGRRLADLAELSSLDAGGTVCIVEVGLVIF